MRLKSILASAIITGALAVPGIASAKGAAAAIPAPAAGKGQIVFYRPGSMVGAAMRCTIRENGKMVGRLMRGKYLIAAVEPGVHNFTTKTEATDRLNVNVDPDETQYVSCKIGGGFAGGRPNLSPSSKADFDAKSAKLNLVDSAELAKLIAEDDGN